MVQKTKKVAIINHLSIKGHRFYRTYSKTPVYSTVEMLQKNGIEDSSYFKLIKILKSNYFFLVILFGSLATSNERKKTVSQEYTKQFEFFFE